MRAVLSARSTKVPSCEKSKISLRSMVPKKVPRISAVSRLIASSTFGRSRPSIGPPSMRFSAIQASLMLSQVSRVSAVRTMRALLRAVSIDDITLDGLPVSRSRKSETVATVNSECRARNASSAPALTTTEVHSSSAFSLRVSAMRRPASSRRAMFSARSM